MNKNYYFLLCGVIWGLGMLVSGCLLKPKTVTPREFVLSPASATQAPANTQPMRVEVGLIKMPSYLTSKSMSVRKGPNEIAPVGTALWADRLDLLFRQTLMENLSHDLALHQTLQPVHISVDIQQFDVDTHGQGALRARWRLSSVNDGKLLNTQDTHLIFRGASPHENPQAIASTLSALTAQFSRVLARSMGEGIVSKGP